MGAIATTAARIGPDLRALGARAVDTVDEGIKVTFSLDAERFSVMSLVRDEVDGVRLIADHSLESGHAPLLSTDDAMHMLGGGEVGQVAYDGLVGIDDIVFSQSLRGADTLTIKASDMERADSLRRLLRDDVVLNVPGAERDGFGGVTGTTVPLHVQSSGIYG